MKGIEANDDPILFVRPGVLYDKLWAKAKIGRVVMGIEKFATEIAKTGYVLENRIASITYLAILLKRKNPVLASISLNQIAFQKF
jgi:hypothetical protein